jgi:hypothetical protein
MMPIFVELADIMTIPEAEFSPNMVYSLIGIELPLFVILLKNMVFALS